MTAESTIAAQDSPRRLLVLASTFPRWEGDTEPRFVEYLSRELAERFEVTVLAPHCPGAARDEVFEYGDRSVAVHRFRYFIPALQSLAYDGGILMRLRRNPLRYLLVPFFLLGQTLSAMKLQRRHGFDVMQAHWIIPQGIVAALLTLMSRRTPPVLITAHGGDLFALRGTLATRIKRWVLARAAHVSVVSEAMRPVAAELGCPDDKITVRSMGVDLRDVFTPPDSDADRDGLVFVGRLVEKKGVRHLVEAMGQVIQDSPDLRLSIIGDGPLRGELERLAASLQLESSIHFTGSVPNVELPGYLRRAKIAVMPSVVAESGDQEGLGLVAVEAMGCGCAVVASDLPAVRDVVRDGETGLMAKPGDAGDLAAGILRLLGDDSLRRTLAGQGRRYALENFDWRTVGETYAELLSGLRRP